MLASISSSQSPLPDQYYSSNIRRDDEGCCGTVKKAAVLIAEYPPDISVTKAIIQMMDKLIRDTSVEDTADASGELKVVNDTT